MIAALHSSFGSRTYSTLFRLYDSERESTCHVSNLCMIHIELSVRFQNYRLGQDFKLCELLYDYVTFLHRVSLSVI